ncbi:protein of unknown function [Poseidonocella pacifica]|uniref:YjiS-like domain-containing protein n=1 Tax=Poseidonocella pacifica TaxID=871651 RepID=A0A1I0WJ53_9RHOB|nr:DUF1127 domain-containing protein [Poseidonocella pacifica]SFA88417.1 protein of unknown function [Poseidonocella pacifica]
MTSYVAHRNTTFDLGIAAAAYRIVTKIADWRDARVTRRALYALSDHELEDIGLSRSDIQLVARRSNRA